MEDLKLNKAIRQDVIDALVERDGYRCMYPGCTKPFTDDDPPTIDHWNPWSIFKDGSLENLCLMHFGCNNKKANVVPNADGTIDVIERKRSVPKAQRPEICETCMSGRILLPGEICPTCGSGAMPPVFPTSMKKKSKNCKHGGADWCCWCVVGIIPRLDKVYGS